MFLFCLVIKYAYIYYFLCIEYSSELLLTESNRANRRDDSISFDIFPTMKSKFSSNAIEKIKELGSARKTLLLPSLLVCSVNNN